VQPSGAEPPRKQSARYVGRFVPPPTYRVGRLPPSPQRVRARAVIVVAPVRRAAPSRLPAPIFRYVQHHSP